MILWLSGAVSGKPDRNFAEFRKASYILWDAGFCVLSPLSIVAEGAPWDVAMRQTIAAMLKCNGVARLEGWRESKGARIESRLAKELGMPVKDVAEWAKEAENAVPDENGR